MKHQHHSHAHAAMDEAKPASCCSPMSKAQHAAHQPQKTLADADAAPGTIYTCPMHPEIRQVGPGSCPICAMALEPLLATADTGPNPELADMTRRFWIGLVLTVP